MSEKEDLAKQTLETLRRTQGSTLHTLDMLRRTRAARGGVGAPLLVPPHLRSSIEITDADLKATPMRELTTEEEIAVQHFGEETDEDAS